MKRLIYELIGPLLGIAVIATIIVGLFGCTVGKTQSGQIVLGIEAGRLAETSTEAASWLATMLPPPFGTIATGGIALLAGWGAEKRARNRENQSWEESQKEAKAAASERLAALLTAPPQVSGGSV